MRVGQEQRRPRGAQRQVIGVLHAERDLAGDVLLGVLRADGGEQPFQRGDVARRRGTDDAVVEGHQIRGQRAAAGAAGAAELLRVDLRPARQVIEAADAVPDAIGRRAAADEQRADAGHGVFGGAAGDGRLALGVEQLDALALADRIVAQRRDAVLGQQDAAALDVAPPPCRCCCGQSA